MQTFHRGFFCEDLTLRHPYRECTITVPMLLVLMLLLPMLFIAVVEIMRICKNFRLRTYIRNMWQSEATFSFGFIATYLTTELAKNAVGRLRPHFYTACQPRMPDGSSCEDRVSRMAAGSSQDSSGLYVEQYYCSNRNLTMRQVRELHVSFPSAHSSLSFYAMLFLAFYLHAVWKGRGTCRVLRHILQFLFIILAWFISLSRVADYWHHWSDVLAGGIMGVVYAIVTATYVGEMLDKNYAGTSATPKLKDSKHSAHLRRDKLMRVKVGHQFTASHPIDPDEVLVINSSNGANGAGRNSENDCKLHAVMPA